MCVDGIPITIGTTVYGNISYSTIDSLDVQDDCIDGDPPENRGVWYNFVGTGERLVARSCKFSYYTSISIFTGVCGPASLQCVAATSNACQLERFFFDTEIGETYHVLLQSFYVTDKLDLSIFVAPNVPNDYCNDATPITIGTPVYANITYATADTLDVLNDCLEGAPPKNRGIWYSITGTGERLVARSCNLPFFTSISIYTGKCGLTTLQCTAAKSRACERFFFDTVEGTPYLVLIQSMYDNAILDLSIFVPPTLNDLCINALPISIGATVYGNLTYASTDSMDVLDNCLDRSITEYHGVWYNFTGTGERLVARSCMFSYFTYISIFTGNCGLSTLQCVAASSSPCQPERFFFDTEVGQTYFVLLQSLYDAVELSIFVAPPVKNDLCIDAIPITIGTTVSGNMSYATSDINEVEDDCQGFTTLSNRGVWYSLVGSGKSIEIDTCGSFLDFSVSVYTGDCNPSSLECVAVGSRLCRGNTLLFESDLGTTYFILLTALGRDGLFRISVYGDRTPISTPIPAPTTIPTLSPNPSLMSYPKCEVLEVLSSNVLYAIASDPGYGIRSARLSPPTTSLLLESNFTQGAPFIELNISVANNAEAYHYRNTTIVVENMIGEICVFPSVGSILDKNCVADEFCLPDDVLIFPFPNNITNQSFLVFDSLETILAPTFATIELNETNLLYIPTWNGIEYDAFALEGITDLGDSFLLSVEYFGINKSADVQFNLVVKTVEFNENDDQLQNSTESLQVQWHHKLPQVLFNDVSGIYKIPGIDDAFINQKEYGVVLHAMDYYKYISPSTYNDIFINKIEEFVSIYGRLPNQTEVVLRILEEVQDDPRVGKMIAQGIRAPFDYQKGWIGKLNQGIQNRVKKSIIDKIKGKALVQKGVQSARKLANIGGKSIPIIGKILDIGLILQDISKGRPLSEIAGDFVQGKIPLWAELRVAYDVLKENGIIDQLGLPLTADEFLIIFVSSLVSRFTQRNIVIAWIRGDPHITTMDGLEFDCQARGEFTLLKSLNSTFHIQSRFTQVPSSDSGTIASVTSGIVVRESEDTPLIQISLRKRDATSSGTCFENIQLFENNIERILRAGVLSSAVSVSVIEDEIAILFTESNLEIHIIVKSSASFDCFLTYWIYLPEYYRGNEYLIGLLGNANGTPYDDWQTNQGEILPIRDKYTAYFQDAYDYCRLEWCVRNETDSLFTYNINESFSLYFECDAEYVSGLEDAFKNASSELIGLCGDNVDCIIDGIIGTSSDAQSILDDNERIDDVMMERNITYYQSKAPSTSPTLVPSPAPKKVPTFVPTLAPRKLPTSVPTPTPKKLPTPTPTSEPKTEPTPVPTIEPCGLFGLNIFCPITCEGILCRFLKRLFGL